MNTISDTLKKKKAELQDQILMIDSEIDSMDSSKIICQERKAILYSELEKINTFLTKESELDAIFNK